MLRTSISRTPLLRSVSSQPSIFKGQNVNNALFKTITTRTFTKPENFKSISPVQLKFQNAIRKVVSQSSRNYNSFRGGSNFGMSMTIKLMATNVAVFILVTLWSNRNAERDHFVVSLNNMSHGRIYTMITSAFTHFDVMHILVNMFVFHGFASQIESFLGPKKLLQLCLLGGMCASAMFLAEKGYRYTTTRSSQEKAMAYYSGAVGASGVTMALFSATSVMFPQTRMLLFFVIPVQARLLLAGLALFESYRMIYKRNSTISASGHLGGIAGGLLFAALLKRGL
jgi:membrane associated rhomboid family serine protease